MSNPEPKAVAAAATEPQHATAQILEPRDVPLGGLRAMNVRRTLPQRQRSLIGAWCFLDHYGPDNVAETGGMNVPAHPHTGLQTVSWLFSGEIEHRDSAGFHAFVRPGELNLMTAGRGISHSERSTAATTQLHGAQLWVALPEHARGVDKTFEHYAPPVLTGPGWIAQVFLGTLLGDSSPVRTHSPLVGAEIRLEPGASLTLNVNPSHEHGVLVDSGSIALTATGHAATSSVSRNQLGYIEPGATELTLTAGAGNSDDTASTDDAGTRILLLGGEPLREQIVMWWNFIGRDHDEIAAARRDWQAQIAEAGVGDPSTEARAGAEAPQAPQSGVPDPNETASAPIADRYGLPENEPDAPLPAPALPIARLVPRTNPNTQGEHP